MLLPKHTPLALAVLVLSCMNDGHIAGGDADPDVLSCGEIRTETIDTGAELDGIEPGESVGLFVEYAGAGRWRIQTTCDTLDSDYDCYWDVIVASKSGVSDPEPEDLETNDYVDPYEAHGLRYTATTRDDLDGFTFLAAPGEIVEVDAFLDGNCQPRFVYWVSDGEVTKGAPSNPIRLEPSED